VVLDGGGIRGAFIAAFLAKLQEHLDQPLIKYFDLVTGTSTGGLIAVALAMGTEASELRELYETQGEAIFKRPPEKLSAVKRYALNKIFRLNLLGLASLGLDAEWLYQSKFDSASLKQILTLKLGDKRLADAQCRLAIPSVDLTAAKTIVFKTPHRPDFVRDRHFRAVDVILATAAAPSYFPGASIEPGSSYCDGGVWANNPAMVGYVEAVRISRDCLRPEIDPRFNENAIHLLSIGTGRASYYAGANSNKVGLIWWAPRLLNLGGQAQSEGIHWQMQYLLGERYTRIDFSIPEGEWALDSVGNIPALLHFGSDQAVQRFNYLKHQFFSELSVKYTPF
jgi:hypothetical protein